MPIIPTPLRENVQTEGLSRTDHEMSTATTRATYSVQSVQAEGLLPFIVNIMEAPMPEKSTSPVFEKYDRSTDPYQHIHSFVNIMAFYSSSDLIWCQVFSLSLKGDALAWFNTLPPHRDNRKQTTFY